jgi:glycosyltransferase involved in cell wall biosynthesis
VIVLEAVADGRLSGGTTHVLQLIETLAPELPAEIHLVSQAGSAALAEAARRGTITHGIDFFVSRLDPRPWCRLRALVRELRPALIHAHGARAALPLTWARGSTPLLYSVHGYHFVGKSAVPRRLAIAAERRCSAAAATTVFVSGHDQDLAARDGILERCRRHVLIRNAVDLERLPAVTGGDGRTLAFLGRLSDEKNPLLLLDVLKRLPDGFRLRVIGDGPLLDPMRERAAAMGLGSQVSFLGSLPRQQALAELARSHALLVPSLWEGLPLAPLEAMAIGVPVVASRVGGIPEVVADGESGVLVAPGDAEGFAAAVSRLAAEPGLRTRIISEARRTVAARFSWQAAARAYLGLYRETLKAAG